MANKFCRNKDLQTLKNLPKHTHKHSHPHTHPHTNTHKEENYSKKLKVVSQKLPKNGIMSELKCGFLSTKINTISWKL